MQCKKMQNRNSLADRWSTAWADPWLPPVLRKVPPGTVYGLVKQLWLLVALWLLLQKGLAPIHHIFYCPSLNHRLIPPSICPIYSLTSLPNRGKKGSRFSSTQPAIFWRAYWLNLHLQICPVSGKKGRHYKTDEFNYYSTNNYYPTNSTSSLFMWIIKLGKL